MCLILDSPLSTKSGEPHSRGLHPPGRRARGEDQRGWRSFDLPRDGEPGDSQDFVHREDQGCRPGVGRRDRTGCFGECAFLLCVESTGEARAFGKGRFASSPKYQTPGRSGGSGIFWAGGGCPLQSASICARGPGSFDCGYPGLASRENRSATAYVLLAEF